MNQTTTSSKRPRFPLWTLEKRYAEARRRFITITKLAKEAEREMERLDQLVKLERAASA